MKAEAIGIPFLAVGLMVLGVSLANGDGEGIGAGLVGVALGVALWYGVRRWRLRREAARNVAGRG